MIARAVSSRAANFRMACTTRPMAEWTAAQGYIYTEL